MGPITSGTVLWIPLLLWVMRPLNKNKKWSYFSIILKVNLCQFFVIDLFS